MYPYLAMMTMLALMILVALFQVVSTPHVTAMMEMLVQKTLVIIPLVAYIHQFNAMIMIHVQ
jgi:hypothetical protein